MSSQQETRIPLHCHCCGREILAELVVTPKGRKVVIVARRHGVVHCVAIPVQRGPPTTADVPWCPRQDAADVPYSNAFLTTPA